MQKNQKAFEAKTIINGQEVTIQEAQAAQETFEKQNTTTGIQQHHDNTSEAVQAGEVAQNAQQLEQATQAPPVRKANLQSGQQHLEPQAGQAQQKQKRARQTQAKKQQTQSLKAATNQAISEQQKDKLEDHETIQNSLDAAAQQAQQSQTTKAD